MKIYYNIIQGTDEWKELRHGKVGGSSIEKIMANSEKSVKNNAIFFDLFGEINEDFEIDEDSYTSKEMQRGIELEPIAVQLFEKIYNKKTYEIGWAEINDFVGISPDRLIGEPNTEIIEAMEVKCPSSNTYAKYLLHNDIAISDYCWQLAHYFVTFDKLEKLNFLIFRPENKLQNHILIEITKNTEVKISAKKTSTIGEMVFQIKNRLEELQNELHFEQQKFKTFEF